MKKYILTIASLFMFVTHQAQDRPMPKPGPSPSVNIKSPEVFTLKNGLKVMVVENHKLPRVSFTLTIDNAPYAEGDKKGVSDLLSSMIGNGTLKTSKDKFNEEIDFLGANINFWGSGASASGLSKYSNRILQLMGEGALQPLLTQEDFDAEKAKLIEGLKTQEKNVQATASRVEDLLVFGKNHPNGEYTSENTLNNITLADVVANYNSYFVPEKAYLVVVGDVKTKDIKKQITKIFGSWKKSSAPKTSYEEAKDIAATAIHFVDMPNAVQSEVAVLNLSDLKKTNKDYFAALLANQILGGGGEGRLFLNLREAHGWTYGAYSSLGSSKYGSKFRSGASVRNAVTDSAVVEILNEIKRIRTELVSDEELQNAKAKYVGNFVMQVEKPSTIANYALTKETEGLPADFYENYIKNINAVTAEDLKNAANKYFKEEQLRILVVGKAADVLSGLEKLSKDKNFPITYYDKYGKEVEKPIVKKDAPKGVTAQTVLNNYINAIGGTKAISNVQSTLTTGTTKIPQAPAPLSYTSKSMDKKGKFMVELSMSGMSLMKQVVNGDKGYMMQQGQKMELTGKDLTESKDALSNFPEIAMLSKNVTLKGIENLDGKDAYAVVDGSNTYFFDVITGLKIASSSEQEVQGQKMTQTTYFKDYKDVKGVKFPHNIVMNVGFELDIKIDSVKVNEGVTDADFN